MNEYVANLINENIELIDLDKFDELYEIADKKFLSNSLLISELTATFKEAGINPLDYLTYVPEAYHFGDSSLISDIIPEHIKRLDMYAYQHCDNLKELTFNCAVGTIPTAFCNYCSTLQRVKLPENLVNISTDAFEWCSMLMEIKLPATLRTIGSFAFANTGLTEIELPDSVLTIGAHAFPKNCVVKIHQTCACKHELLEYTIEYLD